MYANGTGVDKDIAQAAVHFRAAALGGNGDAALNLGRMIRRGTVAAPPTEAEHWLQIALEHGNQAAAFDLLGVRARIQQQQQVIDDSNVQGQRILGKRKRRKRSKHQAVFSNELVLPPQHHIPSISVAEPVASCEQQPGMVTLWLV